MSQLFLYICLSQVSSRANQNLKPNQFSSYLPEIYISKCILYIYIHIHYVHIFYATYLNTSRCLYILVDKYRKYFTEISKLAASHKSGCQVVSADVCSLLPSCGYY